MVHRNPTPEDSLTQWRPVSDGKYLNIGADMQEENLWPFHDRMKFWEKLFPL